MALEEGPGQCEACGARFEFHLVHDGFNESAHGYCRDCGCTLLVSLWGAPTGVRRPGAGTFDLVTEDELAPCECGGRFSGTAAPRCPRCAHALDAERAAAWIEAQVPAVEAGWRWQGSWDGLYAIVIEGRSRDAYAPSPAG